jgi:hypothetical protein
MPSSSMKRSPIGPLGDGRAQLSLGGGEQLRCGRPEALHAVLGEKLAEATFAQPRSAELAADVAQYQLGRAAVGGDDALDVAEGDKVALVTHGRQLKPLVEHLARLTRAAARHRAADVALVGDAGAEAQVPAGMEHRREHRHVGRMRAAALVGVVDEEGVARGDVAGIGLQDRGAAGGEGADVERQHDVLGDHPAGRIEQGAGGVLRFTDDGGEAGAEQRVLHLAHDAAEARADHLQLDGADRLRCCGVRHRLPASLTIRFLN